jgi:hypothetical protein
MTEITVDIVFKAKDGAVLLVTTIAYNNPVAYSAVTTVLKKGVEINKFHKMRGHCGSDRLEKTANIHGFRSIGEFQMCKECAILKPSQKNVKKMW